MKIKIIIKAILFGVDETVIDTLKIGNGYNIIKDSMINKELWHELDYTAFGMRRIYEITGVNDNLDIAILMKTVFLDIPKKMVKTIMKKSRKNI